jgi:Protein of unknown function DUF86
VKDDAVYLRHILDAIDRILSYNVAGRESFVHDYFGVSLDIVWDVVENHLGPLRNQILPLLPTDWSPRARAAFKTADMDATAGPRGSFSAIAECEVNDEVVVEYDEQTRRCSERLERGLRTMRPTPNER